MVNYFVAFIASALEDARINRGHLCVYLAFLHCFEEQKANPIYIRRSDIMKLAKIRSFQMYHQCINELQEYGYVEYGPSYHPGIRTTIYLKNK